MSAISPLAQALNEQISASGNAVMQLLSKKGRSIYFPSQGILGQTAEAKGAAINATIGTAFEEDGSPLALECLEDMVDVSSTAFLYAPSFGLPALRQAWKSKLEEKNPSLARKAFSEPVVTNALTHALSIAAFLFLDEQESIIMPDMNWDNYDLIFGEGYGVTNSIYATFRNGGFNVAGLEEKLAEPGEKKVVLLNFPNNPTGYTVTEKEAETIVQTLTNAARQGKKIVVLLDDAYFGLVYEEGIARESLFAALADAHDNILAVKLDGPTKEDYVWGFRVGFITFGIKNATPEQYKALEAKAAGVVRANISNSSRLSQELLLKAYRDEHYNEQKEAKTMVLKNRYLKIKELLAAHPEYCQTFEPMPFNSGYFMCVRPLAVEAEAVRKMLLADFQTGVIVLSGLIRLAFSAVPIDKLDQLFANLHEAITRLKK